MSDDAPTPGPYEAPAPSRRGPSRRVLVAGGAGLAVAAGTAVVLLTRGDDADASRSAAEAVARSWSEGRFGAIASEVGVVAGAAPVPADLEAEYARLAGGLAGLRPTVSVVAVTETDAGADAELDVAFDLGRLGASDGSRFAYRTTVALRRDEDRTVVAWSPAVVHPALAPTPEGDAVLRVQREQPARADILDAAGGSIVAERDVVAVGVQPSRTTDAAATAAALAGLLDVDGDALRQRITQARPDAFVAVITLRRSDYDADRAALQAVPGAVFRAGTLPLAPTRAFARALLGSVGEVTADVVEASDGRYVAGDQAGLSGVQAGYDARLAGRVGIVVQAAPGQAGDDGPPESAAGERTPVELLRIDPVPGQTVQLSLDPVVQQAADEALAGVANPCALVVLDTADGSVRAVANGPADGGDRALTGRYAPGSTFKVVTTLALLAGGFDPASTVSCPATLTVSGRSFRNFEGEVLGDVPFTTDFAQSCNTAFASLAPRLDPTSLRATAATLGLGVPWATGVDAFSGDVPETTSEVDRAAASFGQGRTLASPLAMATVAASVAARARRTPRIVLDPAPEPVAGTAEEPSAEDCSIVADLMREVVLDGTATVLRDVPGAEVRAKTGTAEYGTGSPPPTHAWTIGWRGSLAFAVLVEDGVSGGSVAAPVARDLLTRVAAAQG
ncbi:penicillin-binding transpeptidase domain-containing protein [Kineococcus gynurae]|uniref:Beta-lactamase n=1 Tax=Kineococcus gynurae TaxID=452979 RepID=A0ABV5LTZ1_9ACTN